MVVGANVERVSKTKHIEFVDYTGSFPNLCSGVLTLKIDGEIVKFGNDCKHDSFWNSGGWIDENYYSHLGEWEISLNELPEQIVSMQEK